MCRVLGASPSGYYGWLERPKSRRDINNEKLLVEIRRVHIEYRQAYGARKVWQALRRRGVQCGKNRVARIRQRHGIEARRRRRFKVTTQSRKSQISAPNILNRRFNATHPNEVWLGDVTYIATRTGWLYLSVVIDLYSRRVIGWSMSNVNNTALVLNALDMAIVSRQPQECVLHHTDRGAVYASDPYVRKLRDNNMTQSMSRPGDCYDNAVAESFFSTLKNELVLGGVFESRDDARHKIFEYIESFYNRRRIHQSLGYKTPEMTERLYLN